MAPDDSLRVSLLPYHYPKAVDEMKKKMIRESIAAHEASRGGGGGGRSQNGPAIEEIGEAKGGDEDADAK